MMSTMYGGCINRRSGGGIQRRNEMLLALCLLLTSSFGNARGQDQKIVEEPKDVRVIDGETAVLTCKVVNQKGMVQWTKNGIGLGSERDMPGKERYSMVGSPSDGEWNLQIKDVNISDDAEYGCQLSRAVGQPFQKSKTAKLTVLVPPEPPVFGNRNDIISATEGREFPIECVTRGGKPEPKISWVIAESSGGENVIRTFPSEDISPDVRTAGKLFNVSSELRYQPLKEDYGKFLVCIATHEAVNGKMVAGAMLTINYAPRVQVKLKTKTPLREGNDAILSCEVSAQPNKSLSFLWRKDGNTLTDQYSRTLKISRVGREHHGSVYSCEARNSAGSGSGEVKLNVHYGPTIAMKPELMNVDVGDSVTLQCKAESNPPVKIRWSKNGNPTILSEGMNLTIPKVSEATQGEYQCEASTKGFDSAFMTSRVAINGPPKVVMQKVVRVPLSTSAEIVCQVIGSPPSKIWWMKEGEILNGTEKEKFAFEQKELEGASTQLSILTIIETEESHFGTYTCYAKNTKATDSAMTQLKAKSLISLYVMLPIMIAALVLLVCLIIFCIFCYRRQICSSKTTTYSGGDEHSDVNVKVEAVDGNGLPLNYCPDMYSPVSITENGEVIQYGKDYFPVPQDNPDLDLLPPPYMSSYVNGQPGPNYSYYNGSTGTTFHPAAGNRDSNGHLVHMTYLDNQPMTSHQRILYAYSDGYGNLVEAYPPADYPNGHSGEYISNGDEYSMDNGNHLPDMSQQPIYYPSQYGSMSNGGGQNAPLATLEPVQELPTPEESVGHGPSASASQYSTFQPTSVARSSSGDYGRQPSPPTFSTMVNSGSSNSRSPVSHPNGGFTATGSGGSLFNGPIVTTPSLHYPPALNSTPMVSTPSTNV